MKEPCHLLMLFVPMSKIKQALVDIQTSESSVRDVFYLEDDKKFAVLVQMRYGYPFLENQWKEKWETV